MCGGQMCALVQVRFSRQCHYNKDACDVCHQMFEAGSLSIEARCSTCALTRLHCLVAIKYSHAHHLGFCVI